MLNANNDDSNGHGLVSPVHVQEKKNSIFDIHIHNQFPNTWGRSGEKAANSNMHAINMKHLSMNHNGQQHSCRTLRLTALGLIVGCALVLLVEAFCDNLYDHYSTSSASQSVVPVAINSSMVLQNRVSSSSTSNLAIDEWHQRQQQQQQQRSSVVKGSLGFYIHVYNQPAAVIHLTRELRRLYPDSPIYIMSDGGVQFNGLCAEIGNSICTFKMCPAANDRWHPWPFLHRIRLAAIALNTEYFVMVEPDNQLHGVIKHPMIHDAGGYDDPFDWFSPHLVRYVNNHVRNTFNRPDFNWSYSGAGLAGGSYFRSVAVVDAFEDSKIAAINWTHVMSLDTARVMSSDYAMPIALSMAGYTYGPWNDSVYVQGHNVTEIQGGNARLRIGFAFSHQRKYKEEYLRNITVWEDEKLYEDSPPFIVAPKIYAQEDKAHEGQVMRTKWKDPKRNKWKPSYQRYNSKMVCKLCWDLKEYIRAYNTTECANPNTVETYGKVKKIWATQLHLKKSLDDEL